MIAAAAAVLALGTPFEAPRVQWSAPTQWVEGRPFVVEIEVQGARTASSIATWLLTPSAFALDGRALEARDDDPIVPLPAGATLEMSYDLAPALRTALERSDVQRSGPSFAFELGYAPGYAIGEPVTVTFYARAEAALDFAGVERAQLADFAVYLQTSRGDMLFELWPDVAPEHVRNFLQLTASGFYDDTTFHRVIPGFMIQGGSPDGTPWGEGPRRLALEPSDRPHVAGVLSMARGNELDSASSQFFVMHGAQPALDGKYSAFGKLLWGTEVVDAIATARRNAEDRPLAEQKIIDAAVVRLPRPATASEKGTNR